MTYEYAFATGAGIPIIAVVAPGTNVPGPLQRRQVVLYKEIRKIAAKIENGIRVQSRAVGLERASSPKLVAKFQEVNGVIHPEPGEKKELPMELWVEHAPPSTQSVFFEIPDRGVQGRKWRKRRKKRTRDALRPFLTDDVNLYGDVEILASGALSDGENWSTRSTLYEALVRYYSGKQSNKQIDRALAQIRDN